MSLHNKAHPILLIVDQIPSDDRANYKLDAFRIMCLKVSKRPVLYIQARPLAPSNCLQRLIRSRWIVVAYCSGTNEKNWTTLLCNQVVLIKVMKSLEVSWSTIIPFTQRKQYIEANQTWRTINSAEPYYAVNNLSKKSHIWIIMLRITSKSNVVTKSFLNCHNKQITINNMPTEGVVSKLSHMIKKSWTHEQLPLMKKQIMVILGERELTGLLN